MKIQEKLAQLGEWSFILGVALLIIRNNSYPWAIKRASDVLFLMAAILAVFLITRSGGWREYWLKANKILTALAFIMAGVFLATAINYGFFGVDIDGETVLNFGRFAEAAVILLLVGFFQSKDEGFYKKVALFQLSTLIYFVVFLFTSREYFYLPVFKCWFGMDCEYRFMLFDNFPTSVSYYLIVSLAFVLVWLLTNFRPFNKKFFIFYLIGMGFAGLVLWTQTRASWLSAAMIGLLILIWWALKTGGRYGDKIKVLLLGSVVIFSLFLFGFMLLPDYAKNGIINRVFPIGYQAEITGINLDEAETKSVIEKISAEKIGFVFYEPSRPYLWKTYAERLIRQPLGLGLNHKPPVFLGAARGPHNTPLEIAAFGGILALGGYIYLLYLAIFNLVTKLREGQDFRWPLYLLASLVGLIVVSQFDNMSTFRLMWVILGLGLYFQNETLSVTSSSRYENSSLGIK